MKRIIFRLFIAILSLATGLVSVWLINSFVNINHSQKTESFYPKNKASVEKTSDGEFVLVSRGCGQYGSNSQTYHFKTGAILARLYPF
jgi:hypothetical protein